MIGPRRQAIVTRHAEPTPPTGGETKTRDQRPGLLPSLSVAVNIDIDPHAVTHRRPSEALDVSLQDSPRFIEVGGVVPFLKPREERLEVL
jgi:hypothetical protein